MSIPSYPYHPATGLRLVKTVDYVPGLVLQTIFKAGSDLVIEDAMGTCLDWNRAETQEMDGDIFLADEDGNQCLASEAIWCHEDIAQQPISTQSIHSRAVGPNELRSALRRVTQAAQHLLHQIEKGSDHATTTQEIENLLTELGYGSTS